MDRSEQTEQQQQQHVTEVVAGAGPHLNALMIASGTPAAAVPSPAQPPATFSSSPHQHAYQLAQQFQQQQLQTFWANQMQEIEQMSDFRNHSLPLARIKKIMKADEDVRMISAEAPVIFAKACEILVLELTLRSWIHTEENKRRTLQRSDIAAAISRTDIFDFLVDIIPRDELKEDEQGVAKVAIPLVGGATADVLPYYFVPQHPAGHPGMIMGKPVDEAALYPGLQPRPPVAFVPGPQGQPPLQQQSEQPQSDS